MTIQFYAVYSLHTSQEGQTNYGLLGYFKDLKSATNRVNLYFTQFIVGNEDEDGNDDIYAEIEKQKCHIDMTRYNNYTVVLDYSMEAGMMESPRDCGYSGNVIYRVTL